MKKVLGKLKYALFFLIGVLLLWLAFRSHEPAEIIKEFQEAKYEYVLYAVMAGLASTFSRALRWNMLIKPFGFNIHPFRSFLAMMTGYLANLAVPRMGEITRCVVINQTDDVPVNKLFGTVVTERIIDLLAVLVLITLALIFEWERLATFFATSYEDMGLNDPGSIIYWATKPVVFIPAFILFAGGLYLAYHIMNRRMEGNLMIRIKELIKGFWAGIISIRKIEKVWLFILHSVFIWSMYILMTYLCFFAVESTSHLTISAAFFVMVIGAFGFIAPVQGGIGAYHWLVMESLVLYDIPRKQGLTFATIAHAAQTVYILIFGGLCLLTFIFFYRKKLTDVDLEELEKQNSEN